MVHARYTVSLQSENAHVYGTSFQTTRKIDVLFEGMEQEKERWMRDHSILVDCIYV